MQRFALATLLAFPLVLLAPIHAEAITVSPKGVNVRTFGPTTVFLTFVGLNSNQRPAEGIWCGAITANQACVPGTVFGRLPARSDLSTLSGSNNFTDIMTIPPSVARRAYQDALRGNSSEFFYVRRFVSTTGGADEFVAVTCRLAGGGARVPLALTSVRLDFSSDKRVPVVAQGQQPPNLNAEIRYNGSGRLKGRWEVVLPGDPPPTQRDLLTEATLPIEQRGTQRRYTLVETFDRFLPPTGQVILPGPNPAKLPKTASGLYLILLRIEATADREGDSFTGIATVNSGGVAGFPLPVLRYYVSAKAEPTAPATLALIQPERGAQLALTQLVTFQWQSVTHAESYRLEVRELKDETLILSAVLDGNTTSYTAPPWLQESAGKSLRWRVQAIDKAGKIIVQANWQEFELQQGD
jgi:hypothetical protein